jgi:hypothetical protein
MLSWLIDNAYLVYLILGVILLALAVLWWQTRKRPYLVGMGIAAALLVLMVLLNLFVTTDRKQLVWIVQDIAAKMNAGKVGEAFEHLTGEVTIATPNNDMVLKRERLQEYTGSILKNTPGEGVTVSNIEVEKLEPPKAIVTFNIRARGESQYVFFCRTEFQQVGGRWKMNRFAMFYLNGQQVNPLNLHKLW